MSAALSTHTCTHTHILGVFSAVAIMQHAQQCLAELLCLSPPPPPHLSSFYSSCLLSVSLPSQVFIYSLHTHCRRNMGIVAALIMGQPIVPESPTLSFSCLSLLMKRIVQQVASQQLCTTVCGKALWAALCGLVVTVKGEGGGLWVKKRET